MYRILGWYVSLEIDFISILYIKIGFWIILHFQYQPWHWIFSTKLIKELSPWQEKEFSHVFTNRIYKMYYEKVIKVIIISLFSFWTFKFWINADFLFKLWNTSAKTNVFDCNSWKDPYYLFCPKITNKLNDLQIHEFCE